MKKIKDTCTLRKGATEIKASHQIESLSDLHNPAFDPFEFLRKTHFTEGMQKLLSEGFACFAGKSRTCVFHLQQAMGGGKTHLMLGFASLARDKKLRESFCSEIGNFNDFDEVLCADFNGRNEPEHFFWGEIALQLGRAEQFSKYWKNGPLAPDEDAWIKLLTGDQPILILFDELPPYFESLSNQKSGTGTQASVAQRAFSNLLTASAKCRKVCIVVSDLTANYKTGTEHISKALDALGDAIDEVNKYQTSITPVDLTEGEIYEILRKRLFHTLPNHVEIEKVASEYASALREAVRAKLLPKGAESIATEIAKSYPFHPSLKHLIALFKENREFRQTRGLMEFISYLLKSVWEGQEEQIYLIGAQHFDLSISDVRYDLQHISGMADVIAKDLWDTGQNAHAQILNRKIDSTTASQVGNILLIASLSTAINARKGVTREELMEYLITPGRVLGAFAQSLEALEKSAWYLHRNSAGKIYFDRQENLTKRLEDYAQKAPEAMINELIKSTLKEIYQPHRKIAYSKILALPTMEEILNEARLGRTLVIYDPQSNAREGAIDKFFEETTLKNRLLFLTSAKSFLISVGNKAKFYYATLKAEKDLREGDPLHLELETKRGEAHKDFLSALNSALNRLGIPRRRENRDFIDWVSLPHYSQPQHKNGESIIEEKLIAKPTKLFLDVESNFGALRSKAEEFLFHKGTHIMPKNELSRNMDEQCAMYWLPPKGLDDLIRIACEKDLWSVLGSSIAKEPPKRRTSVQISPSDGDRDDEGYMQLDVQPINVGESYEILYAENSSLRDQSPRLQGRNLKTRAVSVEFQARDLSGRYQTGDVEIWEHPPKIRFEYVTSGGGPRRIKILVVPDSEVRYTLDMTEPRNGHLYTAPIEVGKEAGQLRVYAKCHGQVRKEAEKFGSSKGGVGGIILTEPALLSSSNGIKDISSYAKILKVLDLMGQRGATLGEITLVLGQNIHMVHLSVKGQEVTGEKIKKCLCLFQDIFAGLEEKMSLRFKIARFKLGADANEFIRLGEINTEPGELKNA